MATFGENLRRERELRGITLAELSNATKIHLRHLTALEEDRLEQLPGSVFSRGFVRAVARYMNLDEHHWVGEYVRAAHEEPEILARYAPPNAQPPTASRRNVWSVALVLVVFGVGAYFVHGARVRRAAQAAPGIVPAAVSPSPAKPSLPPPAEAASQSAAPSVRPRPTTTAARPAATETSAVPGELNLQVDALEDAWVSVAVDGQPLYIGVMKPGETRSFHATDHITITTGNASAVILTLNGETLPPLGNPGERKNVTLTAQDLKPPAP